MTTASPHIRSICDVLDAPIPDAWVWTRDPSTPAPPWLAAEVAPPPAAAESRLLTVAEAAEVVPLSAKQLYRVAARPDSPFRKVEGRLMVYAAELHSWVREHSTDSEASASPAAAGDSLADRVRRNRKGGAA
jgi:hypothetical protein